MPLDKTGETRCGICRLASMTIGKVFGGKIRICTKRFYNISAFYPEDDKENGAILKQIGLEHFCIQGLLVKELETAGWAIESENSIIALARPTPIGEIVPNYEIDGMPVKETHLDFCAQVIKQQIRGASD
jgi:hypothetical protein